MSKRFMMGLENLGETAREQYGQPEESKGPPKPRDFNHTVGAVRTSLDTQRAELDRLRKQAPKKIGTSQIRDSRFRDRLHLEGDELNELVESIHTSGQQLPVLVREVDGDTPYEVVYGRRRIAACRRLGEDVLAIIAEMDDSQALVAQGLENAARLETSYVERAIFAKELLDAGHDQAEIANILGKDPGDVSRLLGLATDVPTLVLERVGPVRDGRGRWDDLRKAYKNLGGKLEPAAVADLVDTSLDKDQRVKALTDALFRHSRPQRSRPSPPATKPRTIAGGRVSATRKGKGLTITARHKADTDFVDFVSERLDALFKEYERTKK